MNQIATPTQTAQSARAPQSLWRWWREAGAKIGDIQARALLSLFYFVVLGPFSLAILLGSDPLGIKSRSTQGWRLRGNKDRPPMERATRQF